MNNYKKKYLLGGLITTFIFGVSAYYIYKNKKKQKVRNN